MAGVPVGSPPAEREAQASLVDVEAARGARMRGCLAEVVSCEQVLWVEQGSLDIAALSAGITCIYACIISRLISPVHILLNRWFLGLLWAPYELNEQNYIHRCLGLYRVNAFFFN